MSKVQKIKSCVTIRQLAELFGAKPNSKGKCKYNPIREERTSSLQIYDDTNSFNDFGGVGGDVIDFYALKHNIPAFEAIDAMIKEFNIDYDEERFYNYHVNVPSKEYMSPEAVKKAFMSQVHRPISPKTDLEILTSIIPEYLLNDASDDDKEQFYNIVRYANGDKTAIVLLPNEKGVAHTFKYRYKMIGDEMKKWVSLVNTKSDYAYCRLTENRLTLIVEGTRDFLTALMCGYSVIAIPRAGFKLNNDLLKDRLCVFIDDDDGKNFMSELIENAICEKIVFNHSKFKEITKCQSKDFSDYAYQFKSLKEFRDTFDKFISNTNIETIEWESAILKIAKPVTHKDILEAENAEWLIDGVLLKRNISTIVGAPNVGKSAFSFASSNRLFNENKINKLLYFDADNPISYVKDRILKLIDTYGNDKILYYNGLNSNPKEMVGVLNTLSTIYGGGEKVLIVIDSLKFFIQGSMNEDKLVSPFFDMLKSIRDRFGATIICLHHTRKSKDDDGKLTYNGSQVVEASTDNMIMLTKDSLFHKKSRSDKGGLKFDFSLNFIDMTFEITETIQDFEIQDEDEKVNNDDYADKIREYLDFCDEELNTTQIIEAMKGIVPSSKCHKILKEKKYKESHWCNFKKEGSKNEWVYKARKKVQSITYSEDDYKMELPLCLR